MSYEEACELEHAQNKEAGSSKKKSCLMCLILVITDVLLIFVRNSLFIDIT